MPGFDDVLSILENKSRREILELLTKEPHYALQLSELLQISQQAVVKHLGILEKAGFVSVDKVPSEKGGPPRKVYKVTESFCLRLDLGPRLFKTSGKMMPSGGPMRLSSKLPSGLEGVIDTMGTRRRIPMNEAMSILSELQMRLEKLDEQRDALIALHQQVMMKVAPSIEDLTDNYEERQLAHAMLDQPRRPVDLDLFSQSIRIQSSQAEGIMAGLRDRLIRDLARSKGNVIAGGQGAPLPWWLVR